MEVKPVRKCVLTVKGVDGTAVFTTFNLTVPFKNKMKVINEDD